MKKVTYDTLNGKKLEIKYDENAPCIICGLPVQEASMGGTVICPSCDCGCYRNGEKFTFKELLSKNHKLIKEKAKKLEDEKNESKS